jgi:hypothetical protein
MEIFQQQHEAIAFIGLALAFVCGFSAVFWQAHQ